MEACFRTVHRMFTAHGGPGAEGTDPDAGDDGSGDHHRHGGRDFEVELADARALARVIEGGGEAGRGLHRLREYIESRIVWLSPALFLVDSEGPFDFAFQERHGGRFLLDLACGPTVGRQRPRRSTCAAEDLSISVCVHREQPVSTDAMDVLLDVVASLRPKALAIYGDLGRALEGDTLRLPISAPALRSFLELNSNLVRLHVSNFRLDQSQFDSLGGTLIRNLRLGFVECEDAAKVHLNVSRLEVDVAGGPRNCFWSLHSDSRVKALLVRTRQNLPTGVPSDDAASVECIAALGAVLFRVRPVDLCLKVNWFTRLVAWEAFFRFIARHPTLRVVQVSEFFPQMRPDDRRMLCSRAVAQMMQDNYVLQQIDIPIQCRDERTWSQHVQTRLDANTLKPRVQELLELTDRDYRRAAMGAFLQSLRYRPGEAYFVLRNAEDIIFNR